MTEQVKYENGREVQIGDTGIFIDATEGQGYVYEGTITVISEQGRLTIEGPTPTLIMPDYVKFYQLMQ